MVFEKKKKTERKEIKSSLLKLLVLPWVGHLVNIYCLKDVVGPRPDIGHWSSAVSGNLFRSVIEHQDHSATTLSEWQSLARRAKPGPQMTANSSTIIIVDSDGEQVGAVAPIWHPPLSYAMGNMIYLSCLHLVDITVFCNFFFTMCRIVNQCFLFFFF